MPMRVISRKSIAVYVALVIPMLCVLIPVYWLSVTSVKPNYTIMTRPPELLPRAISLEHYSNLILGKDRIFFTYFRNGVIVSLGTVIVNIVLGTAAGYVLSRFRFRGRLPLMITFLGFQMFPLVLLLIPIYISFNKVGLLNSYTGLIIVHSGLALPFSIWLLKKFIDKIPIELEHAGALDGCSTFDVLWRIVMPLTTPGVLAASIFAFLLSWNEYIFALTLTSDETARTLSPGFTVMYVSLMSERFGDIMTAGLVASLPVLIIYLCLQRYVLTGLTVGGLK